MKKILLATSAMIAAGLMANQAAAQVEVTVGGELRFQAGYVSSEDISATGEIGMAGAQNLGRLGTALDPVTQQALDSSTTADLLTDLNFGIPADDQAAAADRSGDFRAFADNINFSITGTADNGLTYGGAIRFAGGDDRARTFVSGAFGTVQLGDWDSAADQLNLQVPHSGRDRFSNDINAYILNAGIGGSGVAAAGGTKIVYRTTGSALDDTGLTLAFSYAPQSEDEGDSIDRTNQTYNDVGSIAAQYDGDFSGVNVRAGAGYEFGTATDESLVGQRPVDVTDTRAPDYFVESAALVPTVRSHRNLSAYNLGAGVGFGGFDVGVHYVDRGASGQISGFENSAWSVGANYTVGPWQFGVSYSDASQSVSVTGADAAGAATRASYSVDEQRLGFGTTYSVAPGLVLAGDLGYNSSEWAASGDIASAPNNLKLKNDAWVGLVTTRLTF